MPKFKLSEDDEPASIQPDPLADGDEDDFEDRMQPHLNQNPGCYKQFYDRIFSAAKRIHGDAQTLEKQIDKNAGPPKSKREWFKARRSEIRLLARKLRELRELFKSEEKMLWFFKDTNPLSVEGALFNPERFKDIKKQREWLRQLFEKLHSMRYGAKEELAQAQMKLNVCQQKLENLVRKIDPNHRIHLPDATEIEIYSWKGDRSEGHES